MHLPFIFISLCVLLGVSFLSVEAVMAIDKNAVTKGAGKAATRTLNVGTIPTGLIALTDGESRALGCKVQLDTGCTTVFSDGYRRPDIDAFAPPARPASTRTSSGYFFPARRPAA
jgi:hypothetical protein